MGGDCRKGGAHRSCTQTTRAPARRCDDSPPEGEREYLHGRRPVAETVATDRKIPDEVAHVQDGTRRMRKHPAMDHPLREHFERQQARRSQHNPSGSPDEFDLGRMRARSQPTGRASDHPAHGVRQMRLIGVAIGHRHLKDGGPRSQSLRRQLEATSSGVLEESLTDRAPKVTLELAPRNAQLPGNALHVDAAGKGTLDGLKGKCHTTLARRVGRFRMTADRGLHVLCANRLGRPSAKWSRPVSFKSIPKTRTPLCTFSGLTCVVPT
jgi:hypothetical protein